MRDDLAGGQLDLLLLAVLSTGPAHGYAALERLREQSARAIDLPEGSVYPALHRLERNGLLKSSWDKDSGRARRVYRLTARGRRELGVKQARWRSFSRAVNAVVDS